MLLGPALLATALTAGPTLAIVDVDSPDMMMGLGAQVTRAIVKEAQAQKVTLVLPDELRRRLDPKKYEQLRKCGGKPACAANELSGQGLERVVLGSLTRDEKSYLLKLWLIDLEKLEVIADVDRAVLIAARRLEKDVEQAVPPLLRGEREARGTLVITCNVPTAQVSLNGEFLGTPPQKLSLKPGKYEVKVERAKYLPVTRLFGVEANQTTTADVKLLLMPGQVPDEEVVPKLADAKPDGAGGQVTLSPLTFVLGGVTIAAAGTGLAFGLIAHGQEATLRGGYDLTTDTWAGTRAQALEQNRNALIANVSFGVAGAALVGTVISLVVDATHPAPVQVSPAVTPGGGGGLVVGGSF